MENIENNENLENIELLEDESLQLEGPNENRIACKDCKFTYGLSPLHKYCVNYHEEGIGKPDEIYFKNAKCPYYQHK